MPTNQFTVVAGPAERMHDGWDGRSNLMYRLDLPCGCRASYITGFTYSVCIDHLRVAMQADCDSLRAAA